jgi:hypothetical protein
MQCVILYINSLSLSVSQSWARIGHTLGTHWARAWARLDTNWARARAGWARHGWAGHGRAGPERRARHGQIGHGWTGHGHGWVGHGRIVSECHGYPLVTCYFSRSVVLKGNCHVGTIEKMNENC